MESIPSFKPTLDEFESFDSYIDKIYPLIANYGACKIVKPDDWKHGDIDYKSISFKIKKPQKQKFLKVNEGCWLMDWNFTRGLPYEKFIIKYSDNETNVEPQVDFSIVAEEYWNSLATTKVYGNNQEGSLFELNKSDWNMKMVLGILDLLYDNHKFPGVVSPYLYFGTKFSTFCCHTEDLNLYSINYLHTGMGPKSWYIIPPEYGNSFINLAAQLFPEQSKSCDAFLNHKNIIIHPEVLAKNNIKYYCTTQFPGEFVVTLPFAIHFGFNQSQNVSEALNFARPNWLPWLMQAKVCKCKWLKNVVQLSKDVEKIYIKRYSIEDSKKPKCTMCNITFASRQAKYAHKKSKHGPVLKCSCGATFTRTFCLNRHRKRNIHLLKNIETCND